MLLDGGANERKYRVAVFYLYLHVLSFPICSFCLAVCIWSNLCCFYLVAQKNTSGSVVLRLSCRLFEHAAFFHLQKIK